nr:MLO-like protein 9 [Tanacetum cinerariifolium]
MGGGDPNAILLDQTATWAVACVCAIIVIISVVMEHSLHSVGHVLKKRHKPGLMEALDKIKNELMILGFISLLLVFSQNYIASICVSKALTKDFLPCKKGKYEKEEEDDDGGGGGDRRLLWYVAGDGPPKECKE